MFQLLISDANPLMNLIITNPDNDYFASFRHSGSASQTTHTYFNSLVSLPSANPLIAIGSTLSWLDEIDIPLVYQEKINVYKKLLIDKFSYN